MRLQMIFFGLCSRFGMFGNFMIIIVMIKGSNWWSVFLLIFWKVLGIYFFILDYYIKICFLFQLQGRCQIFNNFGRMFIVQ